MERLSETQKRRSNSDDNFDVTSTKQKKSRCSGTDTIAYLREKTEKDFELRAEELKLKREQLDMEKQRQEASQNHMEMLIQSSQQQMNAMLLSVGKLAEKLSYRANMYREISVGVFDCIPKQPQEVFYKKRCS